MRTKDVYQVQISQIRFHKGMLGQIIGIGLPSGMQNSIISFANIIVQTNINKFGVMAVAGCGVYSKIEGFAFLPITCFAMSLTTFIGQNLGAKAVYLITDASDTAGEMYQKCGFLRVGRKHELLFPV